MGGKNSGNLFNNWLKNFALTVFTQSFHAFFLVFALQFLSKIQNANVPDGTEGITAIMAIVVTMALIKFEKLIKDIFGIQDGMMGDIKTSGAKMLGAAKAVGSLGKTIGDPFIKHEKSKRVRNKLGKELVDSGAMIKDENGNKRKMELSDIGKYAASNPTEDKAMLNGLDSDGEVIEENKKGNNKGNTRERSKTEARGRENDNTGGNSEETNNLLRQLIKTTAENGKGNGSGGTSKLDEYNKAVKDTNVSDKDRWWNAASAIAGASVGMGMFDESSEMLMAGAIISKPFAKGSTTILEGRESERANKELGTDKFDSEYVGKKVADAVTKGMSKMKTGTVSEKATTVMKGVGTVIKNGAVSYKNASLSPRNAPIYNKVKSKINNVGDL